MPMRELQDRGQHFAGAVANGCTTAGKVVEWIACCETCGWWFGPTGDVEWCKQLCAEHNTEQWNGIVDQPWWCMGPTR